MTLVKTRAAFETAIKDAVSNADPTVTVVFDNTPFNTPGLNKKYVMVSLDFTQSTTQPQGAAVNYYVGSIQCNIYVPKSKGSAVLSSLSEAVIDGLTSINASSYTDPFSCSPRIGEVNGPIPVEIEDRSHFLAIISCAFSANK